MASRPLADLDLSVRRRQLAAERQQIDFLLARAATHYDAASLRNRYTVISALIEQTDEELGIPPTLNN